MSLSMAGALNREQNSRLVDMKFEGENKHAVVRMEKIVTKKITVFSTWEKKATIRILRTNMIVHLSRTSATFFFSWKKGTLKAFIFNRGAINHCE